VVPRDAACWPIRPGGLGGGKHAVLAKACGDRAYKHLHAINIRPAWSGVITFTVFPSLYPIAENQASNKTRCARRGVNSRSTRRARPRLPQPTPRAPVPSRSLEEAGAEICYEPPSKLEGATRRPPRLSQELTTWLAAMDAADPASPAPWLAAPAPAVPGRTTWLAAGCRAADPALAPAPWLTRRPPRLSQYERLELVMRLFLRALQRLLLGLLSQSHEPPPNRGHAWQLRPTGASRRAHARRPAAHQTKAK
jgi:hypothetical protein